MITIYQTNENSIVSELTILDLSYFKDEEDNVTVRVFTCYGENGVQNLIDSPESASVELIILGKLECMVMHMKRPKLDINVCVYNNTQAIHCARVIVHILYRWTLLHTGPTPHNTSHTH